MTWIVGSCLRHYWQNGGTAPRPLSSGTDPGMKELGLVILTCFFLSLAELTKKNSKVLIVLERSMRKHRAFCSCAQKIIYKVLHLKQRGFLFFEQQRQCRTQVKLSQGHVVSRCGIRLWLVGSRLSTWAPCLSEQDCPTSDGHLGCWWSWPCVTICYGKDTVSIASNSGL